MVAVIGGVSTVLAMVLSREGRVGEPVLLPRSKDALNNRQRPAQSIKCKGSPRQ